MFKISLRTNIMRSELATRIFYFISFFHWNISGEATMCVRVEKHLLTDVKVTKPNQTNGCIKCVSSSYVEKTAADWLDGCKVSPLLSLEPGALLLRSFFRGKVKVKKSVSESGKGKWKLKVEKVPEENWRGRQKGRIYSPHSSPHCFAKATTSGVWSYSNLLSSLNSADVAKNI